MKKKDDFLLNLGFVKESPEEKEKQLRLQYDTSKINPENMSYWFPKIESSKTRKKSLLKLPETKVIQLDYKTWKWLRSDNYSKPDIQKVSNLLNEALEGFLEGQKLFMKTGIFSDKFVFYKTIIEESREGIGNQFLDIFYNSMIVGASNTSEAVFREYVDSKEEDVPKIYNGMPLHTEFRVFYDFDAKEIVGVSNYWHPDIMEQGLHDEEDKITYKTNKDKLLNEYNTLKEFVCKEVELFMGGCDSLRGKWSVDVMKNGEDYWLIDMARMARSALLEVMEVLGEGGEGRND